MKTAFFTLSARAGGAERVMCELANHFIKSKSDLVMIFLDKTEIFYPLDERIKIYNLGEDMNIPGFLKILRLVLLLPKLVKILKAEKIEQVMSFLPRCDYLNVLSKVFAPHRAVVVAHSHYSRMYSITGLGGKLNSLLTKLLVKRADVCCAVSRASADDLRQNYGIKNAFCVYNPVDIGGIAQKKLEPLEVQKEGFTFVHVGRFNWLKNHKMLINAMLEVDAKLWLVGAGELENEIKDQISALGLENKIKLMGKQTNPFKYIANADCFVLSSINEGLPTVLIEALACGAAVISTDCKSGPREILAPNSDINKVLEGQIEIAEFGVLTPNDDAKLLAAAMREMMRDASLKESLASKAYERAKDFDSSVAFREYERILNPKSGQDSQKIQSQNTQKIQNENK